jgi:hypothetical protein
VEIRTPGPPSSAPPRSRAVGVGGWSVAVIGPRSFCALCPVLAARFPWPATEPSLRPQRDRLASSLLLYGDSATFRIRCSAAGPNRCETSFSVWASCARRV